MLNTNQNFRPVYAGYPIRCVELNLHSGSDWQPGDLVCNGWIGGEFDHLRDERYQAHIYCAGQHDKNGRIELIRAICDCEGPHFIGAQISCRGLDGVGATGIFAK